MDRAAEDLLRELRAVDESVQIEVKRGSKVDRSVLETVCKSYLTKSSSTLDSEYP